MRPLSFVLLLLLGAVTVVPDAHPVHRIVEDSVEASAVAAWEAAHGVAAAAHDGARRLERWGRSGEEHRTEKDDTPFAAGRAALNDRLSASVDRRADRVALTVPPAAERSLDALAAHLRTHAGPTMRGRTRAAFRWVTEHVAYDVGTARGWTRRADQSPAAVLRSGRGVCEGYARLFVALAERMGLRAAYVVGTADPVGPGGGGGHAWTAVRLADGWYLLDPTWAAGGTTREDQFVRSFDPAWWLVPPERMIHTHRPRDARWALGARDETEDGPTHRSVSRWLLRRLLGSF